MARRSHGRPVAAARGTLAVLSLATAILLLGCARTEALAPSATNKTRLDNTVRFLQNAQNTDGGFTTNGNKGEASDPDFTAWAALALAAAGINPQDQALPEDKSAYTYLTDHVSELSFTTDFERVLLVVDASGTSPQDFGGVDLVHAILARQLPEGAFFHETTEPTPSINDTIFAILALSPIKETAVQEAVQNAMKWLESERDCNGSWPATAHKPVTQCPAGEDESEGEVDLTAAAVEALNAAGVHDGEYQAQALGFLHTVQNNDGGFPESSGEHESNSGSTSWAVQAIWAAGENPETWITPGTGKEPLGYLESMQHENGSIQWKASSDANPVWMTAYAAPAYAGRPLPIPSPPRNPKSPTPPSSPGQGGESTQPGSGVIAGGGGDGAPLFGRPQLGSKGHTPGGARQLKDQRHRTTKHRRNPGPPRNKPVPTATSASVYDAKKHDPTSHKVTGGVSLTVTGAGGGRRSSGRDVKGILIGVPADVPEPGAPGLHGAGAGTNKTPWFTIGVEGALLLSVLIGTQIELRRGELTL
jgi:prenyltransferase beta subunit